MCDLPLVRGSSGEGGGQVVREGSGGGEKVRWYT